jgi:hypothetical protein
MINLDNEKSNPLLSIARASKYLRIPLHTFKHYYYNVSNQTAPVATKLGTRVFFTEESLDNFVKSNTQSENEA